MVYNQQYFRPTLLWNERDKTDVNAFEANRVIMELVAKIIEILLDDLPTSLDEINVETIWTMRLVGRQVSNNGINLSSIKGASRSERLDM